MTDRELLGWVKIDEVRQNFDTAGCGTIYKTGGEGRVPLYTAPQREWEILVERVRRMRDVQGWDGNWNCDPYMHGLFNGLEFALSLIEVREPKFRDAPEKWLCDQPKARIFCGQHHYSGGGNNG